ncbi:MAG: type II toxin-antitoxin system PemK/MazF family toxin [Blastocatellia bacterium]|nr:type II toxin-antitoxin system PemK/MazF family toxin [Blastocatellia bacterium]MBK6429156.1 type II toxin-antitoxin system PemK/MazF family toxin [Blastocatellia bacterium]
MDPTVGHEQRGVRPCIAVSDPAVNADQRFPLIAVVPLTGTLGEGSLYPELSPGTSGLTKTSFALIDRIRSIDKRRILLLRGASSAQYSLFMPTPQRPTIGRQRRSRAPRRGHPGSPRLPRRMFCRCSAPVPALRSDLTFGNDRGAEQGFERDARWARRSRST